MLLLFKAGIICLNHLVPYLHEPEVCEFFYKIKLLEGGGITTIVRNVQIQLDEETLEIILGVPVVGVRIIKGCKPTGDFSKLATKGDVKRAGLPRSWTQSLISDNNIPNSSSSTSVDEHQQQQQISTAAWR
ncbi:hypothetical protein H5410_053147 [Solanum commersonii]|uniref:Uncharacterized protein n=1 Tax=Solanum commersonii TaxID=4109 RepID=A0A9J5X685_SOLCO|nr:hypothetical protein H5410_053147 [Solanum commersonii]